MKFIQSFLIVQASLWVTTQSVFLMKPNLRRTHRKTTNFINKKQIKAQAKQDGNKSNIYDEYVTNNGEAPVNEDRMSDGIAIRSSHSGRSNKVLSRRHNVSMHRRLIASNQERRKKRLRQKGEHKPSVYGRRSCPMISEYRILKEAEDIFGDVVQVAPFFQDDGMNIDQVFYESYCDRENCRCTGIDKKRFTSACETNYMLANARVIKEGKVGWSQIKIRSGCSCILKEKMQKPVQNILDLIK